MAWRQESKLLEQLSKATSVKHFTQQHSQIQKLRSKVASELQQTGGLQRLLFNGLFVKQLFTAASSGLVAIRQALGRGGSLTTIYSSSMASFFSVIDRDLLRVRWLAAMTPSAASELTKGPVPAPAEVTALLTEAVAIIKQTGFLESLASACSALTAATKDLLQSKGTASGHAAATAAAAVDIAAISSLTTVLLNLWAAVGAIWGCTAARGSQEDSLGLGMFNWSDPQLHATIQPSFCLISAVIHLEAYLIRNCRATCRSTSEANSNSLFAKGQAFIWKAVVTATAFIGTETMTQMYSSQWVCSDNAHESSGSLRAMMQQLDIQQLQLFMLAAVAGGLHRQLQGISPVLVSEPAPADGSSSSSSTSTSSAATGRSKAWNEKKRRMKVADCTPQLLQQLGLHVQQGEQLYDMLDSGNCSEMVVSHASFVLTGGSREWLFDNKDVGGSPVLRFKLMMQLIVLMDKPSILPGALTCLMYTAFNWNNRQVRDNERWETKPAAVRAVADSILAPLILEVGPVVLQTESTWILQWTTAVQELWTFYLVNDSPDIPRAQHRKQAQNIWRRLLQQRPFTTAASFEGIIRSITHSLSARPAQPAISDVSLFLGLGLSCTLDMVHMFLDLVPFTDGLLSAAAAASEPPDWQDSNSSSNGATSGDSGSSWLIINNQDPAARIDSLLISCLKFVHQFLPSVACCYQLIEKGSAERVAITACDLALALAAASSDGSTALAVPWLHVAARALHCCASAVLWSGREGAGGVALSADDITFLHHMWGPLTDRLSVCQGLLYLQETGTQISSTIAASGDSCRGGAYRCAMPEELLEQLLQQFNQLQDNLDSAQQRWSAFEMQHDDKAAYKAKCQDSYQLAEQLQQYSAGVSALMPTTLCCNNLSCCNVTDVSELRCVGRRKCSKCQMAGYCSRECQTQHWSHHKKVCSWLCKAGLTDDGAGS